MQTKFLRKLLHIAATEKKKHVTQYQKIINEFFRRKKIFYERSDHYAKFILFTLTF